MNLVFVYGTLRRGKSNHDKLSDAKFITNATTKEKYLLTQEIFPCLYENKMGKNIIFGEIYEVSDSLLTYLDHFEGCPDFYYRKEVEFKTPLGDVSAYVYFKKET